MGTKSRGNISVFLDKPVEEMLKELYHVYANGLNYDRILIQF